MNFTTKIPISKSSNLIDYNSKIMSLGSCFAENMGEKFDYFKFQTTVNPFGIIFNPVSLLKIFERCLQKKYFTENDIFFHNDLWHCYEVHSELSNPNKEDFLIELNTLIDTTYNQITKSTHIIITLGTSWIYRNLETNEIVANCHKVPQKQFAKELLSISEIEKSLRSIISLVQLVNPNCNFVFTVSPVRHTKDGFMENTLSKAHLISAIHATQKTQIVIHDYFPSYEIMMDELRDYRFYAEDMLHPSKVAVNYIWARFTETYFEDNTIATMQEVDTIQKGLAHKPFHSNYINHLKFLKNLNEKISNLQLNLPFIHFNI